MICQSYCSEAGEKKIKIFKIPISLLLTSYFSHSSYRQQISTSAQRILNTHSVARLLLYHPILIPGTIPMINIITPILQMKKRKKRDLRKRLKSRVDGNGRPKFVRPPAQLLLRTQANPAWSDFRPPSWLCFVQSHPCSRLTALVCASFQTLWSSSDQVLALLLQDCP